MNHWNLESILATSRAFMESRIMLTAAELDLFTLLSGGAKSLEEIAAALKSDPGGTEILLDALAAMELLEKKDGRYACPEEVAKLLSSDSRATVLPMLNHAVGLWRRWSDLTEIVRHGSIERPAGVFRESGDLAAFIGAMHAIGRRAAQAIAERAEAQSEHNLLDIGGATGTYSEAFLRQYPDMHATIFDQPAVIQLAEKRLAQTDVKDRITLVPGDFYTDELPQGYDLALLSAIIHQNSLQQNVELYKKAFRALEPGGRILIRDHVMSEDRTEPRRGALFAVNMLVATTGGNCYTFAEIRDGLEAAGFEKVRLLQSGGSMDAIVEGCRPE